MLQTHGDAAVRRAFERRLAEQAIGAEYIALRKTTRAVHPLPETFRYNFKRWSTLFVG